jgi:hypothetical protein
LEPASSRKGTLIGFVVSPGWNVSVPEAAS